MNKETIEKAAEEYSLKAAQTFAVDKFTKNSNPKEGRVNWDSILEVLTVGVLTGHKFGAKWQKERMYSEEDMIKFHKWAYLKNRVEESDKTTKELLSEWFEQNKKK